MLIQHCSGLGRNIDLDVRVDPIVNKGDRNSSPNSSISFNPSVFFIVEQFIKAAKVISNGFGLTLFGFDVIVPVKSCTIGDCGVELSEPTFERKDDLVVIDVNFFPSYKEVKDFPDKLCAYLLKRAGIKS